MGEKKNEGIENLREAIQLVRRGQDPLMFLRAGYALLCVEREEKLIEEVRGVITQIKESLLNTPLSLPFEDAEPIRILSQLG
jgi:hypothetical protein